MPQATLLREPWFEYLVINGRGRTLRFQGGETRRVTADVVKRLLRERLEDGSPLFNVVDDPPPPPTQTTTGLEIIPVGLKATVERAFKEPKKEQHVLGSLRQMGLKDVAL